MLGETKKSATLRKSAKLPKLNIQQQIDNQQIAERMNRKVAFTRNPRHTNQTMTYAEAFTSNSFQNSFRVEPEQLFFTNYDLSHIYESQVKFINNSKHIQRIKITPLNQKEFVLANVKYPREDSGDIAPGMAVVVSIRFRPTTLNDYQDELMIIVGEGVVKVPIIAQRQKCDVVWPKVVECGHCWVGDVIKKEIVLKNRGGDASFYILNTNPQDKQYRLGYFKVTPTIINFQKNSSQKVLVQFQPQIKGNFKQTVTFKSSQGQQQQVQVSIEGGAYSAQIVLEHLNGESVLQQKINNTLYLSNTELDKQASASLKIRNLAVVQVDYFWHISADNLKIDNPKGKIKPSELLLFNVTVKPKQKTPQTIRLELYLFNLPEKSLVGNVVSKNINGVDAIQCLVIEIKTKPVQSNLVVTPLHQQIVQPIYRSCSVEQTVTIINYSSVRRSFTIEKIKEDEGLQTSCDVYSGSVEPNSQQNVSVHFHLKQLTAHNKIAYFLVSFDNASSQIFSISGKSTFPELLFNEQVVYYGLCKTFTLNKKKLTVKNPQKSAVEFRFINNNRFYFLDFYDFYQFENEQSYKKRFNIYNPANGKEILDWFSIAAESQLQLDCYLNTLEEESISLETILEVKSGKSTTIPVLAQVQDVCIEMSRELINLKQIYKGNVYNSNKFLSKELQFVNRSNHDCAYSIDLPDYQQCLIKIDPLKGILAKREKKRIDLVIEPIKTGNFDIRIKWKYFDDFKVNPGLYPDLAQNIQFNQADGRKYTVKQRQLQLTGTVKGMEMNYYLKDESRAKKIRQKIQDFSQSVKLSASSLNSSMKSSKGGLLQNQKIVYPILEELNFYNCQINQVRQVEIIIENDSGLTTQYEVYAEQYRTLEKPVSAGGRSHKGLVRVQEEAFSSEMGKTFIKNRVLDKSQKVHLGNNKGISVLCQPAGGTLNKKQSQKVVVTMFNDTSGRFKDNLLINVKNHEIKKIPMDIHIKGTPVALSRNQLGIDFNQQIPLMNLGTMIHSNGLVKRSVKVVNNGPKQVQLKWLIYPYNKTDKQKDVFDIIFREPLPGTNSIVDLKWNALKPQIDTGSHFTIEPQEKTLKGREEAVFTIVIEQFKEAGEFSNLLICQPYLVEGADKTQMESLAVVVSVQTVEPRLFMDVKHSNHINKLQRFALPHEEYQTNSNNFLRKLKFKNILKTNLAFDIKLISKHQKYQSFKLVSTKTNSPANTFIGTVKNIQTSFVLTYDSILEVEVELSANCANLNEWPMEEKVRRDGQIILSYSSGQQQTVDLVGWLYRPWMQVQMPNDLYFSNENFEIDFGVVHFKNTKKMSIFLTNPSKVDAKWTITYIKYHQSIKYKFQQSLWTALDYEDQSIQDEKKCWRLSVDSGVVKNKTTPVHYMPPTLALPSQEDRYTESHKPVQVVIMFKPESNVLYKSKFKISVAEGPHFNIVVKGRGSFDQQLQNK